MIKKLDLYMQAGVSEYRIVDTEKKEIMSSRVKILPKSGNATTILPLFHCI